MAEMLKVGNQPEQNPVDLTLIASVFVDFIDDELAAGRWQMLPDGELVPVDVDRSTGKVIQFPQHPPIERKEQDHAQVQGSAATS